MSQRLYRPYGFHAEEMENDINQEVQKQRGKNQTATNDSDLLLLRETALIQNRHLKNAYVTQQPALRRSCEASVPSPAASEKAPPSE